MRFRCLIAAGICLCGVAQLSSAQTLQLRYGFDEPSGDALDTGAPPAANGQLVGGAVRSSNAPAGLGSSIDFNTETPYAHVLEGDAAKLDGLNQLTLTTWLNVTTYTSGNNRLMAKQAAGTFGGFSWNMNATTNNGPVGPDNFRLALFLGNNISSGATDFAAVFSNADVETAANNWVFLAVTYDGTTTSNNVNFYIGGEGTPVAPLGTAQSTIAITVDGGPALFGVGYTDAAPAANTSVLGLQDDVRVYSGSLSLAELEAARLSNIPEPATAALLGMAGASLLVRRRRI